MNPVPLREVCPDVVASRSMAINPWIPASRPCCTVAKTPFAGMFRLAGGGTRTPTTAELKQLCSFPEGFRFPVSAARAWNVMGNAVPPLLAMAVAEHIRDNLLMQSDKPFTVISTFSGGGGSSCGYHMAGGNILAAVEFWPPAVEVYKANFPETPVICRDIAQVTAEELLALTGLSCGQLDILDGSPPCQGFSTAGKRQVHDPRNSLFKEFVRLLDGLQPRVFVMENVSGMVKGQMKWVFAQVLQSLKGAGYRVECRLLDAMYFGVPQSRQRVIFIGVRNDLGIAPSHPKPQTRPIPLREALPGIVKQRNPRR